MTFIGAVVVALIGAWVGSRLQAARTRRHWHEEMGVDAWRSFVNGLHAWRGAVERLQHMGPGDGRRDKTIDEMERCLWAMSPDAPAIHVFAPPTVDRAARDLLREVSEINDDAKSGRPIGQSRLDSFDAHKWGFVVLAASEFDIQ